MTETKEVTPQSRLAEMSGVLREMADVVLQLSHAVPGIDYRPPTAIDGTPLVFPVTLTIQVRCGERTREIPVGFFRDVYNLTLVGRKIDAIKMVRSVIPETGLKYAKEFVESGCGGLYEVR